MQEVAQVVALLITDTECVDNGAINGQLKTYSEYIPILQAQWTPLFDFFRRKL